MSAALTEMFSENKTSPIGEKSDRRGRPRVLSPEVEAAFSAIGMFTECKTRRSRLNIYYRTKAMGVLKEGFEWLFDGKKVAAGVQAWKPTILIELGRIEDEELMRAMAEQLCELKPSTRDAVLMVRRLRTGGLPAGDALQLANEIIATVNRYIRSHANVTKDDLRSALATAAASVNESL